LWKDELIEILFSNDPSKINAKKAINLKYENTPSSLYRYRSFNRHSLDLLKTDKIKLSRPTDFNDPFDCGLKMAAKDLPEDYIKEFVVPYTFNDLKQNYGISNKNYGKLIRSKNIVHDLAKFIVKTKMPNISLKERNKIIEEEKKSFIEGFLDPKFKEKIHVACFSETYESNLMWSHYANDHKGFCVEYNFKELGIEDPVTRFIFPVLYQKNIFDLKNYLPDSNKEFDNVLRSYMDNIKEEDILNGIKLPRSVDKRFNNMLVFYNALIKSEDWKYEKEWRYVFTVDTTEKKYLFIPKPKAIYLGAKISKKNFEEILKIVKDRNINVYKMETKNSEYSFETKIIYETKN